MKIQSVLGGRLLTEGYVPKAEREDRNTAFEKTRDVANDHFFEVMRRLAPGQWEFLEPDSVAGKDHAPYFKLLGTSVIAQINVIAIHGTPKFIGVNLALTRIIKWTKSERKHLPQTRFRTNFGAIWRPENLHHAAQVLARMAAPKIRLALIARAAENLAARKAEAHHGP